MKVLFLGGVFDDSHNDEIISKTRTYVEYAANNFQKKIIQGLRALPISLEVVSVPFLGAYPTAYADSYFYGFSNMRQDKSGYKYCSFNNVFAYRNVSRYHAAKNGLADFIKCNDSEKLIIVYSPHTPFLRAANWAKRKDSRIKICMIVPDLPQYMNLSGKQSIFYRILKKIDLKKFASENEMVDSYIVLTKQMAKALNVGNRPYKVVEGIYEAVETSIAKHDSFHRTIVYTGKLNYAFGALNLVKAFHEISEPSIRLVICGNGEAKDDIARIADIDARIEFRGQVSSDEARQCILNGDILVNPRPNDSDYTKYSFPSKIIDYLATGNPVVAFKLDGMPDEYEKFIYCIPQNTIDSIRNTIETVLEMDLSKVTCRTKLALGYMKNKLSKEAVAKMIINLNFGTDE